jgi:hypothetical protein
VSRLEIVARASPRPTEYRGAINRVVREIPPESDTVGQCSSITAPTDEPLPCGRWQADLRRRVQVEAL